MDPYLLDSFAARTVGTTLDDFTRRQRVPVPSARRLRDRRRRAAVALSTTLGVAAPALTVVVLVAR